MTGQPNDKIRILLNDNRIITRKQLFEEKEKFHREQAKLPFEEKIKILVRLQKIAREIKSTPKSPKAWEI